MLEKPISFVWTSRPAGEVDPFPYQIQSDEPASREEFGRMVAWCHQTFGPGRYGMDTEVTASDGWLADIWSLKRPEGRLCTVFRFRREADRVVFVLAWSGVQTP